MNIRKFLSAAALGCLALGLSGPLDAVEDEPWNVFFCNISNSSPDELVEAISRYNRKDEGDEGGERWCKTAIRFMKPQTIKMKEGVEIKKGPPTGYNYGLAIRRCIPSGNDKETGKNYKEAGCQDGLGDKDVILDFSEYVGSDGKGECPIRITSGAKVDIMNIKILAKNPDKVICDTEGKPIPLEDDKNPFAWIHNVTIMRAGGGSLIIPPIPPPPVECRLISIPRGGGEFELVWWAKNYTTIILRKKVPPPDSPWDWLKGILYLETPTTTDKKGSLIVKPEKETTYTLFAGHGTGGTCDAVPVTLGPPPPPLPPFCGNKMVEAGEDCEPPGTATCDSKCKTIIPPPQPPPPPQSCGNKMVEAGEDCEPPGTATCDSKCKTIIPPSLIVSPDLTCGLKAPDKPDADGNYDLAWSSQNATKVTVSEEAVPPPDKKDSRPEKKVINDGKPAGTIKVKPAAPTVYTIVAEKEGGSCTYLLTRPPPAAARPGESPKEPDKPPLLTAEEGCGCRVDGTSAGRMRDLLPLLWIGLTVALFRAWKVSLRKGFPFRRLSS